MKEKFAVSILCFVQTFFASISFMDTVDLSLRVLSFVITAVVSFFIIRYYVKQHTLQNLEEQLKRKQIEKDEK